MPGDCGRKKAPEWAEVIILENTNKQKAVCRYCNQIFTARIENVRSHIKKCSKSSNGGGGGGECDGRCTRASGSSKIEESTIDILCERTRDGKKEVLVHYRGYNFKDDNPESLSVLMKLINNL